MKLRVRFSKFGPIKFIGHLDTMRFDELISKYADDGAKKKSRFRTALGRLRYVARVTRMFPAPLFKTFRYSGIGNILNGRGIVCGTGCRLNIDRSAKLEFEGFLTLGRKKMFKHSKEESKLFIGKNAKLTIGGDFAVDAGNDIEIFDNAELIIRGGKNGYSDANTGLTIICGQKIEIMADAGIGRNVTIRDTNGTSHYINTTGYRPSRPVVIGERAWLCESCTVMQGVKIGTGAIVGACSLVTKSVPDHAMVSGVPAEVVQNDVLWKM